MKIKNKKLAAVIILACVIIQLIVGLNSYKTFVNVIYDAEIRICEVR